MLAVNHFAEASDRVFQFDVLAFESGELSGNEERLREEPLNLASAGNDQLVFVGKLVETENRDDVLKIFVTLQNALHVLRSIVMLLADDARIENARRRRERIDRRINSQLDDLTRESGDGVKVRKRSRRRRIGVVVRRYVDRLN